MYPGVYGRTAIYRDPFNRYLYVPKISLFRGGKGGNDGYVARLTLGQVFDRYLIGVIFALPPLIYCQFSIALGLLPRSRTVSSGTCLRAEYPWNHGTANNHLVGCGGWS